MTTEFNEAGPSFSADAYEAMTEELFERIEEGDICVISGSVPPGAPEDIYAELITALKARGCKTFLDTSGACLAKGLDAGPYFAKPNASEAGIGESIEEAIAVADTYIAKGIHSVIISLGRHAQASRSTRYVRQAAEMRSLQASLPAFTQGSILLKRSAMQWPAVLLPR